MIGYEYPMHERVRTWLRLENLFDKITWFCQRNDARDHQVALQSLFDLMEITMRQDLKSELLLELERQRHALTPLRDNPAVDRELLESAMGEINRMRADLLALTGKPCQALRDNEWITLIRGRSFIPGATCGFDIPSFHYWLNSPSETRQADLRLWLAPFEPLRQAVNMVLRLLRDSRCERERNIAQGGSHQFALNGRNVQLLTIELAGDLNCVPEISAGKHVVNIRFVQVDKQHRPRLYEQDIAFTIVT